MLGDDGTKNLARGLQQNQTSRELQLYGCKVGNEGAVALADMLRVNKHLRILNIQNNQIKDAGASNLARAIEVCALRMFCVSVCGAPMSVARS